eukprot:2670955-Rhodomonas_salina.5
MVLPCYAMWGTDLAYAATQCPTLTAHMLLRNVRYLPGVCCYAVSGTDLAYAATRCPDARIGELEERLRDVEERWYRPLSAYAPDTPAICLRPRYEMGCAVLSSERVRGMATVRY